MTRKLNFNAGPAGLPLSVLREAEKELVDFRGTGLSLMEHSHRGKAYEAVHNQAVADFTELLGVPSTHGVVLLQGGASLQFAMLPLNFLPSGKSADYVVTGHWAKLAFQEAGKIGTVRKAADTANGDKTYTRIPAASELSVSADAGYVHITTNNTIFGTQYHSVPDVQKRPLAADMSSDILCRPTDVSKFSFIYAGAQKNLGPAGLTAAVVDKEWLKSSRQDIPDILRYQKHLDANSLYHTPPCYAIYMFGLNLKWIKARGGAAGMEARNKSKADALYGALDRLSGFYKAPVEKAARSRMNVVFRAPSPELDDALCAEAEKAGMTGLKGHRSAGGVRASLYNAVSPEDVNALVSFLEDFAKRKG